MGNTWKIVLATVVIFAAGVVTGGLLVNHANRAKQQHGSRSAIIRSTWQPDPREVVQRDQRELRPILDQQRMDYVLRVQRELELSPEQRERIEKIVREGQDRSKALWEKAVPDLRKNVQEVRERIRTELKPEQRKKFEQILKQRQARPAESAPGMGPGNTPGRSGPDQRRPVQPRDALHPDRGFTPPADEPPVPPLPPSPDNR